MRFKLKAFSLFILLFPLQGCFTYSYFHFKYVHQLEINAYVGGIYEHLKNYDIEILVDTNAVDTSKVVLYPHIIDPTVHRPGQKGDSSDVIEKRDGYCNSYYSGGDGWGCSRKKLFNDIMTTIVLIDIATLKTFVLDKRVLKISEHRHTEVEIQAYFASDKDKYQQRPHFNRPSEFDWDAAKFIYSEDFQDSLYLYTKIRYSDEPNY